MTPEMKPTPPGQVVRAGSPTMEMMSAAAGRLATFVFAAAIMLSLCVNATFVDVFPKTFLAVVLLVALLAHVLRHPRVAFFRETSIYAVFVLYLFIQMFWTPDWELAGNKLIAAMNFLLILLLGTSLIVYYNARVVISGFLAGLIAAAFLYTLISGFPFRYPADFSYNAVALMYLLGLFLALMVASLRSSRLVFPVVAFAMMAHVVATTSIKTNLGIGLGVLVVGLVHFRHVIRLFWRNAAVLFFLLAVSGYLVISNESVMSSLERGAARISLGVDILRARENLPGYSAFDDRDQWRRDGLEGWAESPIFGNGVEAFRWRYGITSHSTPIDLLHDSGLTGFLLFYSMLASLGLRLFSRDCRLRSDLKLLFLGTLVCFTFITISGTMQYSPFLAVFVAVAAATLGGAASGAWSRRPGP